MDPLAVYREAIRQGIPRDEAARLADTQVCYEVALKRLRKRGILREPTAAEIDRLLRDV